MARIKEDRRRLKLLAAAMELYRREEINADQAAERAGISKIEFLDRRGEFGVRAFTQTPDEFDEDLKAAAAARTGKDDPE